MKRKPKPKRPYRNLTASVTMLAFLMLAALLFPSAAGADCYTLGGVQWNRWVAGAGAQPVKRDGNMMATAGYACQAIEGKEYSLDLGGAAGVLGDSTIFDSPRTTLGAFIGGSWGGKDEPQKEGEEPKMKLPAVTIGVTPHWVTREPFTSSASYGVGLTLTTRFGNILDGIGNLFSDSMGEAFKESGL